MHDRDWPDRFQRLYETGLFHLSCHGSWSKHLHRLTVRTQPSVHQQNFRSPTLLPTTPPSALLPATSRQLGSHSAPSDGALHFRIPHRTVRRFLRVRLKESIQNQGLWGQYPRPRRHDRSHGLSDLERLLRLLVLPILHRDRNGISWCVVGEGSPWFIGSRNRGTHLEIDVVPAESWSRSSSRFSESLEVEDLFSFLIYVGLILCL